MAEGKDLFQVEIITPDRIFFAGEADMLEFNTADGESECTKIIFH